MNIAPEYLAAIQGYGYTRTEAEFLYLVASHSGYSLKGSFFVLHGSRKAVQQPDSRKSSCDSGMAAPPAMDTTRSFITFTPA